MRLHTFSALAASKSCCSMTRISGRNRQSVGATPGSGSFSEQVKAEKPYINSLSGLRGRKEGSRGEGEEGGEKREGGKGSRGGGGEMGKGKKEGGRREGGKGEMGRKGRGKGRGKRREGREGRKGKYLISHVLRYVKTTCNGLHEIKHI